MIIPDSFCALDHMVRRLTGIVRDLVVHPDQMLKNLGLSRGVVFSGSVLLELTRRGISREEAYAWVQRCTIRSHDEHLDFKTLLLDDPDVMGALTREEIEKVFDLKVQLRHVDDIFHRVFREV